ncbi:MULTISPECIES: hypothetical protein [unclassified Pseudomonas]|uniref:hypothetical protein n=1 Tax=unclassified Pseudomonas TaxID=196821 RepID=UPI0024497F8E|nr:MULTISPECIES: hypothetical protein [unclassified Pseudomonas]MDG9922402.1 hypothetical protein [Pseudomonas sp. GD04045]MDH0034400.1 hypothetical protein [Pseudomonas sp. GD04019]
MTSAHIYPTEYEQTRPVDGIYAATVFKSHAEFQYLGKTVIAKAVNACMDAHGNAGKVVVRGFSAEISWVGTAPYSAPNDVNSVDRAYSFDSMLVASLIPGFDEPHPFSNGDLEFRSRINCMNISFGHYYKYSAVLDGQVKVAVDDAPCTIRPIVGESLKCLVVLDDPTIFLARRYGPGKYDQLVANAVNDLKEVINP